MIKEYQMTQEQLDALMEASKSTPVMYLSGGRSIGRTPQENANIAWEKLSRELGFDHMTVRPMNGKSSLFFTAESTPTKKEK